MNRLLKFSILLIIAQTINAAAPKRPDTPTLTPRSLSARMAALALTAASASTAAATTSSTAATAPAPASASAPAAPTAAPAGTAPVPPERAEMPLPAGPLYLRFPDGTMMRAVFLPGDYRGISLSCPGCENCRPKQQ